MRSLDDTTPPGVHSTQIVYFGATYDERIEVESAACKDTRNARQYTWLVLDKAIERMPKENENVFLSPTQ